MTQKEEKVKMSLLAEAVKQYAIENNISINEALLRIELYFKTDKELYNAYVTMPDFKAYVDNESRCYGVSVAEVLSYEITRQVYFYYKEADNDEDHTVFNPTEIRT